MDEQVHEALAGALTMAHAWIALWTFRRWPQLYAHNIEKEDSNSGLPENRPQEHSRATDFREGPSSHGLMKAELWIVSKDSGGNKTSGCLRRYRMAEPGWPWAGFARNSTGEEGE
jgi:hypothetical protein